MRKFLASGRLRDDRLTVVLNGHQSTVWVAEHNARITLFTETGATEYVWCKPGLEEHAFEEDTGNLGAPMNGTIVAVLVAAGAKVAADQGFGGDGSNEMEYTIKSPAAGTVTEVFFKEGDLVDEGAQLVTFTADEE